MKYDVQMDEAVTAVCPWIRLGCLRFQTSVREPDPAFWSWMNTDILPKVRENIEGKEWGEIPGVAGSRKVYKAFGRNPGRYRVSSEALLRRIRRGDALYPINSVVDVNNLLSVTSGLSVGSYDLNKIQGGITLRKAGEGEGCCGIGKDFLDMENMLVLSDEKGIFGSSMSDSRRAMVTESTEDVLVVIYGFEEHADLPGLLEKGKGAFLKWAGARDIWTWIV